MEAFEHIIDVPFEHRHQCWFCGEPYSKYFPHDLAVFTQFKQVLIPSCQECYRFAGNEQGLCIFDITRGVKNKLIKRYKKDLAIGNHWTPELLARSEFEGGSFAGFQRSAWFMYTVAKERVNFSGWRLVIDDVVITDNKHDTSFTFDGLSFPSLAAAITYYSELFLLDRVFFQQVVMLLGEKSFAKAVRFCRLHVDETAKQRQQALRLLSKQNKNLAS